MEGHADEAIEHWVLAYGQNSSPEDARRLFDHAVLSLY
jgi:hypothetical protein